MNHRRSPKRKVHPGAMKPSGKRSWRRLSAYAGASLGALVLAITMFILVFGGSLLNRYGKAKLERACAKAHPGYALQLGHLDYSVRANRLVAQSLALSFTNSTLRGGQVSLTGVRWARFLWGKAALADVLAQASLEATNLDLAFPQARYGLRCARLQTSVPGSELIAEGVELQTSLGDEEFFAAYEFRATRFHVVVPECRVSGLAYAELLGGKSYRASSIQFFQPTFEALVNRDKPVEPFMKSPLMVYEALVVIRQPLQVDSIKITNGCLNYSVRMVPGADPAVLTFGDVSISAEGIVNHGPPSARIQLRAQGDLMNAGVLKVLMTIPVGSPDLSLHYSGSLSAMDLTRLDAFLDIAEHTRIKSGAAKEAAFDIDVIAGLARGRVQALYTNLEIALLNKQTGSARSLDKRVVSFLANVLKVRNSNPQDASGSTKEGKVHYTRQPEDEFLEFAWSALWTGVRDVISY